MENLPKNDFSNKKFNSKAGISSSKKFSKFTWLLASQPNKIFSVDDVVDAIMNSGMMIHEKEFINMMIEIQFRKTGIPFLGEKKAENFGYKNKYMNNDFDYL